MFVEVTRIFIVLMATAAGFVLGRGGAAEAGNGAVIGAVLGACVGYVAGGVLGRPLKTVVVDIDPLSPESGQVAINKLIEGARAAAAEPAVNTEIPIMNIRLRPSRSPSAAPVSCSTA